MQFFDCNVRLGLSAKPENNNFLTPDAVLQCMDYYHVEKALVFHKEALVNAVEGNELLLSEIKGRSRLIPCAVLVPDTSDELGDPDEYIRSLISKGFRAVRFHPAENRFSLKAYSMNGILSAVRKYNLPVFIDYESIENADWVSYCPWDHKPDFDAVYELCSSFPDITFILLYPGMRCQRYQCAVMKACPNLLMDINNYAYRSIEDLSDKFGARRLVYAAHLPQTEPGVPIFDLLYSDITEEEKALIAGGNMDKLIKEVKHE